MTTFSTVLLHFILFIIDFENITKTLSKECDKNEDCSEQLNSQVCSLCLTMENQTDECVYPFSDIYTSSEDNYKCEFITSCNSNPCKNQGTCNFLRGLGYICMCKENHFGKDCELNYKGKIDDVGRIKEFNFNIIGKLEGQENKISFKSTSKKIMPYLLQTNEGYISIFKGKLLQMEVLYEASIVYQFKAYQTKQMYFLFKNKVLGYITTINISGYDLMTEVFRTSFQIFVSYSKKEFECMPVVKLQNCGPVYDEATPYTKASEIVLIARKDVISQGHSHIQSKDKPDCDVSKIHMVWKLFLINDIHGFTNAKEPIMSIKAKNDSFVFKPFKLQFGLYWVELEATIIQGSKESQNSAYCFFKIISLPIKPVIEYGSFRIITSKADGFVMSAVNSFDPNSDSKPLATRWSCTSDLPASVVKDICKQTQLESFKPLVIPPEKIPDKGKFEFTLEIWDENYQNCSSNYCYEAKKHRFAHQEVLINILSNIGSFLHISCIQNCQDVIKIYLSLVLKVKIMNIEDFQTNITYEWTYGKTGSKEKIPWSAKPGMPSYIFDLPSYTLEPGFVYIIYVSTVISGGLYNLSTTFSFDTDTIKYSGTCKIEPEKGVKAQTYFNILCEKSQEVPFTFEFKDIRTQEEQKECNLDGRMLGVSYDGILNHVILTRGTVEICMRHGNFYTSKKLLVNLEQGEKTNDLNYYTEQLESYIASGESSLILQQISLVTDLSTKESFSNDILYILLKGIDFTPVKTAGHLKVHTNTLYNLLSKMHGLEFQINSINNVATTKEIIYKLSESFNNFKEMFVYREIKKISQMMINNIFLSSKLGGKIPQAVYSNLDIKNLYDLSESYFMAEKTLENLKNVVIYIQIPGLHPTDISSLNDTVVVSIFKDDPFYNYTLANMFQSFNYIPVNMSVDLFAKLHKTIPWEGSLGLCVMSMKDNYIHHSFSNDLTSNLLYISLEKTRKDLETLTEKKFNIKKLKMPMDTKMVFNGSLLKQTESGIATQLDPSMGEEALDLRIKVYRLDPEPNSLITITFLYPPTNSSLKVLITKDYRPPFNMIITKHEIINEKTPMYNVSCLSDEDEERPFYYMVILPGNEVVVNNSVKYSFDINNTVCKSWSRVKWSSAGCVVGSETRGNQVHCQCTHLSMFKAISPVLPNEINPFADAKLFLTVIDNPLVVGIVLIMFIIFLILSIWAYRADKRDQFNGAITVLEDNFPGDNHAYLMVVYTSSRFLAGTNANVGVQLEGEGGLSRAHILKCRYHQVLRRDSDCWFLLFSPKSLGLLQKLHIWHDNSGFCPSWYCNEIHVYDLKVMMETIFIVEQWLELNLEYYPEAVILPATPSDVLNLKRLFFSNFVSGIKARESLGGVITKHPRGTVTRFQLLNISMCTAMIAIMCSIMFYQDEKPDDFSYDIKGKEVFVSIVTLVVTAVINFILEWQFEKAYEIRYDRNISSLCVRGDDYEEYYYSQLKHSRAYHHQKGKRDIIIHTLKNIINPITVAPATLTNGKPVVKTIKVWLFIAWLTCLIIIVLSMYITMLYGLKLGLVKSKKWITSLFLSFSENSLFIAPLLVVIIAILLTITFDALNTTLSYQVTHEDILNSAPQDRSEKYMNNLLERRSHPMYYPPSDQLRNEIISKHKSQDYYNNILKLLISLAFIIVINYIVIGLWSSQYYIDSHLEKFIVLSRFRNTGFFQAQNISEINRYIATTFLQSLYSSRWYNNDPLSLNRTTEIEYWTSDFTWKLFGVPSIRQLRVKPESCKNAFMPNNSCIPPWSSRLEDRDDYDVGWIPFTFREDSQRDSPWRYAPPTCRWINTLYRLYGPSGIIYDNGGFIAPLSRSAKESLDKVTELAQDSWPDQLTSVVFMELTLCHSNSPLLSKITLMIEHLVSSINLKAIHIRSVVICTPWTFWKLAFIVIVFLFTVEYCLKINHNVRASTLIKGSNIILMVIVLLGLAVVILRFNNSLQCLLYKFEERHELDMNSYFDYDSFISYYLYVGWLLSFLLVASIFRVIGLLKAGRMLTIMFKVLSRTVGTLMCLLTILLTFFLFTMLIFFQTNLFIWDSFIDIILQPRMVPSYNGHETYSVLLMGFLKSLFLFIFSQVLLTVLINYQVIVKTETDDKLKL